MRNEMMDRPVVKATVQDFLRAQPLALSPQLKRIEQAANERRIPIIPRETAVYLYQLVQRSRPEQILEVGTAIGFSAALFVEASQQHAQVTTIDRFPDFYERALTNWQSLGYQDQIKLLQGDASDLLPTLPGPYQLIFLDAAKAQYIKFLPEALRLLAPSGSLLIDDVLQGGSVFAPESTIRHRNKGIHRNLNKLFASVYADPRLNVSLLPLGDGVLQISWRNQA
ncbi:O-methyltransferase [Lapidilactobacillus luobeiensis]|uniref:O-methyltransferase n=1 Tax=Lapidilactobacillus luobeiensis TaxID=2950371 RepID=UPI0021C490B1|nr:O-methyltransferase [Lapidilactobacillus luobeiensis]